MELNVNSIVSLHRRHELNIFLKVNNPDILLLNETHLSPKHRLNFENYTFIRNDKINSKTTGSGILIKQHIKHNIIQTNDFILNLEHIIIKIRLTQNKFMY